MSCKYIKIRYRNDAHILIVFVFSCRLCGVSPFQADTTEDVCNIIRAFTSIDFPDKYFSPISPQAQHFISSLLHRDYS